MVERGQDTVIQTQAFDRPLLLEAKFSIWLGSKLHEFERQKYDIFSLIGDIGGF